MIKSRDKIWNKNSHSFLRSCDGVSFLSFVMLLVLFEAEYDVFFCYCFYSNFLKLFCFSKMNFWFLSMISFLFPGGKGILIIFSFSFFYCSSIILTLSSWRFSLNFWIIYFFFSFSSTYFYFFALFFSSAYFIYLYFFSSSYNF